MKRALFASLCLTLVFACTDDGGGSEDPTSETSSSGDGDGDGDATTTATGDGDGDPAMIVGTVDGIVLGIDGEPLPTPGLQFCGTIEEDGVPKLCIPVTVEADGTFHIDAMNAGVWSLKLVHGEADGRIFSGQAFQLTINQDDALDYSDPPIVLPEVSTMTPLAGETDVVIEGGLTVTVDPAMAQQSDFQPPTEVGGVIVDPLHWPWTDVEGQTVVQAWAMASFGTKANVDGYSFGLAIDDALGLDAGAGVNVYEIEKDNGALHLVASGSVNGDASGLELTPEGQGLHELSWIVVTSL